MASVPVGVVFNLTAQVISLALILIGLRYAIRTHNAYSSGSDDGPKHENVHKNLMTSAVIVSGLGVLLWMVPNFLQGWFYGPNFLGYGTGGYSSYFGIAGTYNPHWYLILLMAVIGSLTAILGVYLVLRMRWSRFPEALKVQNFRRVMIFTWGLWLTNVVVGFLVFYFYVLAGTG
jgi:uncharacterized membrane protein YozB (DUF420 family)